MTRPLPEDVARTARAYLAALVPPGEVSDAWHELVADATYWGDRDLVPVMTMAHQVVLQHQRLAPEVAVLTLRELDMDQPATVAQVLGLDEATAQRMTSEVAASLDGGPAADAVGRFATATQDRARVSARTIEAEEPAAAPAPAASEVSTPGPETTPEPPEAAPEPGAEAVRIGFEDDSPMPGLDGSGPPGGGGRRLALAAAAVVVLVLLWLVLT